MTNSLLLCFTQDDAQDVENPNMDISQIINNTLTPMKESGVELTASEAGDGSVEDFVINQKHFSRNARLHDNSTRKVVARLSDKDSPPPKKTSDPSKVKGKHQKSVKSKSACTDTAGKADVGPVDNAAARRAVFMKSQAQLLLKGAQAAKANEGQVKKVADVPTAKKSASQRKLEMEAAKDVEEVQATAAKRKTNSKANSSTEKSSLAGRTTAAQRRNAMASTSNRSSKEDSYDVSLDTDWYKQQGPTYRKTKEAVRREKEKEKEGSYAEMIKQRADTMQSLKQTVDNLSAKPTLPASLNSVTPEQLWADSLVPQLQRMEQTVRDRFMFHVSCVTYKAISGTWPEEND